MIKTKAGSVVDEDLVTSAMVELAVDLEGEPGYPLGFSEPNMARNGEEWMVQRGEPRRGPGTRANHKWSAWGPDGAPGFWSRMGGAGGALCPGA